MLWRLKCLVVRRDGTWIIFFPHQLTVFSNEHELSFCLFTVHEVSVKVQVLIEIDDFFFTVAVDESDVYLLKVYEILVIRT